ncbi:MAG: RNA polymerase sigma factor [Saprospiraceae bacterium]
MTETTKLLITKCKNDNRRAQYELFDLFLPYVNVVVRRYLFDQNNVKDVVQEVFITVFKSIKTSYDPTKGAFKPWLRTITINRCIKQNKNNKVFEDLEVVEKTASVEPVVFSNFNQEELLKYLQHMPENYKVVFNMSVIDDYSHSEIATILGISEISSRKKLSRARNWLNQRIQTSKSFFNIS